LSFGSGERVQRTQYLLVLEMLGPFHNAPRTATAVTFGALALTALVAVSIPGTPRSDVAEETCADGITTCGGSSYEKLICDDARKLTKCFDAKTTCASWNVCDCCSPVPLHKCLSPFAGRAFGADCSSPIDAREQCCGDSVTHIRSFQALDDISANVQEGIASAEARVESAEAAAQAAAASATEAAAGAYTQATEAVQGAISQVTS